MKPRAFLLGAAGATGGSLLALISRVGLALACVYVISLTADPKVPCGVGKVDGSFYASDHGLTIKAILWIDGDKVDEDTVTTGGSVHTANVGFNGPLTPGTHNAVIKGYKWAVVSYLYDEKDPPVYDCDLDENIHGTNYDVSQFYVKPTGDDHHCHRIIWGSLTVAQQNAFKAMHHNDPDYSSPNHGNWTAAYNNHIDENPNAHMVSPGGCPSEYEPNPGHSNCRKAVYDWVEEKSDTEPVVVIACHEYTVVSAQIVNCTDGARAVNLYDNGNYVDHLYFDVVTWVDPFTTETGLPAVDFTVPDEYGGGVVHFDAFDEPEDCLTPKTPTSVTVEIGECTWPGQDKSITPVDFLLLEGVAQVKVTGPDALEVVLTESGSLELETGEYNWVATAATGYVIEGPSEGSFKVGACPPEEPKCPACEPRTPQPVMVGRVRAVWTGVTTCKMVDGCQKFQSVVRMTSIDFLPKVKWLETGKIEEGTLRKGADGKMYGDLFIYPVANNWQMVGGANNDPLWMLNIKVDRYAACQIETSYADTDEAGNAYWNPGTNTWEWRLWLVKEGYFKQSEWNTAAFQWVVELREKGVLPLPTKPAV